MQNSQPLLPPLPSSPAPSIDTSYDFKSKLILLGDSQVGKSSLLVQYSDSRFVNQVPTLGIDYRLKTVSSSPKKVQLAIWDTAGQQRFRGIAGAYYKGCSGILFVFALEMRETFQGVEKWLREARAYCDDEVPRVLVANKCDLEGVEGKVVVGREEVEEFARREGIEVVFCSAKEGTGVQEAFGGVVRKIVERKVREENKSKNKNEKEQREGNSLEKSKLTKHSQPKKPKWVCPIFEKLFK